MKLFGDSGYTQISGNTNRLYQFTARLNRAQDKFISLALSADGRWQYDDTNNTDYPIATTNIVANQRDYPLDVTMLEVEKVVILPSASSLLFNTIIPIDITDNSALSVAYIENNANNVGVPIAYDKTANSIILQPTPNYASTGGLKIYFKRGANYFIYTDTTKVPGFASIFHDYLAVHAALGYAVDRTMGTQITSLSAQLQMMENDIIEFYSTRGKDEQKVIRPVKKSIR